MRTLYGTTHVPGVMDKTPMPEENPATSKWYDRIVARAWWGFIYHSYRTGNTREAWELYTKEVDSYVD